MISQIKLQELAQAIEKAQASASDRVREWAQAMPGVWQIKPTEAYRFPSRSDAYLYAVSRTNGNMAQLYPMITIAQEKEPTFGQQVRFMQWTPLSTIERID